MKNFALLLTLFFLFSAMPFIHSQDNCNCPAGTAQGQNLVQDGSFAAIFGWSTTQSDLPMVPDCVAESYAIAWEPSAKCDTWASGLYDHTTNFLGGRYLIVDGFWGNNDPSTRVWFQTVPVVNGLTYSFKFFWRPTLHNGNTANTTLNAVVNGQIIGSTTISNTNDWEEVCFNWISNVSGNVEISIDQADNFVQDGADYGIDDISFRSCTPVVSCICPADEISSFNQIVNSDFSAGNTGFNSDLTLETSTCQKGYYLVSSEAIDKCVNWVDDVFDHTNGDATGSYLIIDGWVNDPSPSNRLWYQDVSVTAGTYYEFDFWWLPRLGASGNVARLSVFMDGVDISGLVPNLNSSEWHQHCYGWLASSTGTVEISINQVDRFGGQGFDYGLDDISFRACDDITQTCQLDAEFQYSLDTESCEVSFTDISVGLGNSTIVGYDWNFGDGHLSTEQNPTHIFNTPAPSYVVCLTVYGVNELGFCCSDTYCQVVISPCDPPSCKLDIYGIFPKGSPKDCSIQFIPGYFTNQSNLSFFWNFDDGTTSTEEYPFHTFPEGGDYNVCLTIVSVTGSKCCSDKHCIKVELECKDDDGSDPDGGDGGNDGPGGDGPGNEPIGPQCIVNSNLYYTQDAKSCEVTFQNWSTAGIGTTILGYHWTFGDGYSSDEFAPTHFYPGPGVFLACLTVYGVTSDGKCCTDTQCYNVYNFCNPWQCFVNVYNLNVKSSIEDCTLNITTDVVSNRPIVGYYWNFGDGTTGTGNNPQHTFPNSGSYNVCVTVVAKDGNDCCTDTYCEEMSVACGFKNQSEDVTIHKIENPDLSFSKTAINIFPNPTSDDFNVSFSTEVATSFDLKIVNLQGKLIQAKKGNSHPGLNNIQLSRTDIAAGTYFVSLIINDEIITEKLIIQ